MKYVREYLCMMCKTASKQVWDILIGIIWLATSGSFPSVKRVQHIIAHVFNWLYPVYLGLLNEGWKGCCLLGYLVSSLSFVLSLSHFGVD